MRADHARVAQLLKTAQGQISAVQRMVEEDRYCIDVSNQIQAAIAMLQKANREVLHTHMRGCVIDAIQSGDPAEANKKIDELCAVFDRAERDG